MKFDGIKSRLPYQSLDEIFKEGDDPFQLLKSVKPRLEKGVKDSSICRKFEEINQFFDHHQREPDLKSDNFAEELLATSLQGILKKIDGHEYLYQYDRHGILAKNKSIKKKHERAYEKVLEDEVADIEADLQEEAASVSSLDDIFNQAGALLAAENSEIFTLKHIPKTEKAMPEDIAERVSCEDFWRFKPLFFRVHQGIKSNQYELKEFSNQYRSQKFKYDSQIDEGDFFILKGVLCLVDKINEQFSEGVDQTRRNPRLRVVFENGMESNMLMRSLAAALYGDKNSRRVIVGAEAIEDAFNQVTHRDKPVGYLYILRSLGKNPALVHFDHLYKIGFTTTTVEDRIQNAIRDVAFLEAPVEVVTYFECFHINPQKLERLTHTFLEAQRLTITLIGKDGKEYEPREWFNVPLETIKSVVTKISNGTINKYRMDNTTGKIVPK